MCVGYLWICVVRDSPAGRIDGLIFYSSFPWIFVGIIFDTEHV
jgi:hypothetical protein